MFRIYVVEDHQDLAWTLAESFTLCGYGVVTAANGLDAIRHMRCQTPDLVVLDVNMPVMDGLTLTRRMRADPLLERVPILFLTVRSDFLSKQEGFRAGGDDYMVKPFEVAELHARVQAMLRRCKVKDSAERDMVRKGVCVLDLSTGSFQVGGRLVQLSEVERDLLRFLMAHAGKPVAAQRLMEDVLDYPRGTTDCSVVRFHIKQLRQKIECDPAHPVHVCTLSARGYYFQPHAAGLTRS